jgi:hypothetical protein
VYGNGGRDSHPDDQQRVTNYQLAIQNYLNMVYAELLELHTCKHVHVSHISLQFFQLEVDI